VRSACMCLSKAALSTTCTSKSIRECRYPQSSAQRPAKTPVRVGVIEKDWVLRSLRPGITSSLK
jgi:hypothetical protein